jgi:hypothetical protein
VEALQGLAQSEPLLAYLTLLARIDRLARESIAVSAGDKAIAGKKRTGWRRILVRLRGAPTRP